MGLVMPHLVRPGVPQHNVAVLRAGREAGARGAPGAGHARVVVLREGCLLHEACAHRRLSPIRCTSRLHYCLLKTCISHKTWKSSWKAHAPGRAANMRQKSHASGHAECNLSMTGASGLLKSLLPPYELHWHDCTVHGAPLQNSSPPQAVSITHRRASRGTGRSRWRPRRPPGGARRG